MVQKFYQSLHMFTVSDPSNTKQVIYRKECSS